MDLDDIYYRLVASGLAVMYIFQIFLTVGGGMKFIPLTGVTLPLVSYGGSSVLTTLILFSIMQGLYMLRFTEIKEQEKARLKEESLLEKAKIKEEKETYYYVKYDNDVICVYFSDEQGNLTKLEETGILYEMLSTEDQIQFKEGVRLKNRDALNKLLMDYES